jgi:hypothetical protein
MGKKNPPFFLIYGETSFQRFPGNRDESRCLKNVNRKLGGNGAATSPEERDL